MASPHPSQPGGRRFRFGQFELSEREGGERRPTLFKWKYKLEALAAESVASL